MIDQTRPEKEQHQCTYYHERGKVSSLEKEVQGTKDLREGKLVILS